MGDCDHDALKEAKQRPKLNLTHNKRTRDLWNKLMLYLNILYYCIPWLRTENVMKI